MLHFLVGKQYPKVHKVLIIMFLNFINDCFLYICSYIILFGDESIMDKYDANLYPFINIPLLFSFLYSGLHFVSPL